MLRNSCLLPFLPKNFLWPEIHGIKWKRLEEEEKISNWYVGGWVRNMTACDVAGFRVNLQHIKLYYLFLFLIFIFIFIYNSIWYMKTYTRYGKYLSLLPSVENKMPSISIDCEIWYEKNIMRFFFYFLLFIYYSLFRYGRGQFALSFLLVKATTVSHWDALRYYKFSSYLNFIFFIKKKLINFSELCLLMPQHLKINRILSKRDTLFSSLALILIILLRYLNIFFFFWKN